MKKRDLYQVQTREGSRWINYETLDSPYGRVPFRLRLVYDRLKHIPSRIVKNKTEILARRNGRVEK